MTERQKFYPTHATESELLVIHLLSRAIHLALNLPPTDPPHGLSTRNMRHLLVLLILLCSGTLLSAQILKTHPAKPVTPDTSAVQKSKPPLTIPLTVPAGTPLKVALDKEVRIQKVGQPIHGKTTEPLYAFDKLLVPVGSEVTGKIAEINGVSVKTRTLAAMNADFSPEHQLRVELDEIITQSGRHLSIHTLAPPGANGVLQFVPANQAKQGKVAEGKSLAKSRIAQAREDAKKQLAVFKAQINSPGKVHRLERFALTESPYRPQYLDPGTSFSAMVPEPLTFGSEELKPEMIANIGQLPASGGVVHAWLTMPLNSATTKRGDDVEAVISQPLIVDHKLYLPQGSELKGTVLQVHAARRFGKNGQLRIAFQQVLFPDGLEQEIQSTLEGVEAARGENLTLDSEGGAQVKASKTRYLTTGIAVMLAASSASPDTDRGLHNGSGGGGDAGGGALTGTSGFKLIGTLVGAFAHSRTLVAGIGAYGAARSIYTHFLERGHDVVYPKNMSMVIAMGTREKQSATLHATANARSRESASAHQ
jgi:hypothetical protein